MFYIISRSINYGAIGFIMAHEMMHALDIKGRNRNKNGIFKKLWSRESIRQFDIKAENIRKEYAAYYIGDNFVSNMHIDNYIYNNYGISYIIVFIYIYINSVV